MGLLQVIEGMTRSRDTPPDNPILQLVAFTSKSLPSAEMQYGNKEREVPGICHGLQTFTPTILPEMQIITDHKPLVAMLRKDVGRLSQRLQYISLKIHQNEINIIYKLEPDHRHKSLYEQVHCQSCCHLICVSIWF